MPFRGNTQARYNSSRPKRRYERSAKVTEPVEDSADDSSVHAGMAVQEILVHVSGPTSRKHDERLRSMAGAYEDFHATTRSEVHGVAEGAHNESQKQPHVRKQRHGARQCHVTSDLPPTESSSVGTTILQQPSTVLCRLDAASSDSESLTSSYIEEIQAAAAAATENQPWTSSLGPSSNSQRSPSDQHRASKRRRILSPVSYCSSPQHSGSAIRDEEDDGMSTERTEDLASPQASPPSSHSQRTLIATTSGSTATTLDQSQRILRAPELIETVNTPGYHPDEIERLWDCLSEEVGHDPKRLKQAISDSYKANNSRLGTRLPLHLDGLEDILLLPPHNPTRQRYRRYALRLVAAWHCFRGWGEITSYPPDKPFNRYYLEALIRLAQTGIPFGHIKRLLDEAVKERVEANPRRQKRELKKEDISRATVRAENFLAEQRHLRSVSISERRRSPTRWPQDTTASQSAGPRATSTDSEGHLRSVSIRKRRRSPTRWPQDTTQSDLASQSTRPRAMSTDSEGSREELNTTVPVPIDSTSVLRHLDAAIASKVARLNELMMQDTSTLTFAAESEHMKAQEGLLEHIERAKRLRDRRAALYTEQLRESATETLRVGRIQDRASSERCHIEDDASSSGPMEVEPRTEELSGDPVVGITTTPEEAALTSDRLLSPFASPPSPLRRCSEDAAYVSGPVDVACKTENFTKGPVVSTTTTPEEAASTSEEKLPPPACPSSRSLPLLSNPIANLSLEIHTPPPIPAIRPDPTPGTRPPLLDEHFLNTISQVDRKYCLASQSRELAWDERGYWRIDTSPWVQARVAMRDPADRVDLSRDEKRMLALKEQAEIWKDLTKFVERGGVGCDVWVVRIPEGEGQEQDRKDDEDEESSGANDVGSMSAYDESENEARLEGSITCKGKGKGRKRVEETPPPQHRLPSSHKEHEDLDPRHNNPPRSPSPFMTSPSIRNPIAMYDQLSQELEDRQEFRDTHAGPFALYADDNDMRENLSRDLENNQLHLARLNVTIPKLRAEIREIQARRRRRANQNTNTTSKSDPSSLGTIRVYHYGDQAKVIYLALYILSKSRIGSCCTVDWVDAGNEVVIHMQDPSGGPTLLYEDVAVEREGMEKEGERACALLEGPTISEQAIEVSQKAIEEHGEALYVL